MKHLTTDIALFQYPGNIIIVDDDPNFTDAWSLKLASKFTTTVFNSPLEAKSFFEKHTDSFIDKLSFVTQLQDGELDVDESVYAINYNQIITLLEMTERYQEPTVLIVDYQMPRMNGLELLSTIKNKNIKKALLTAYDEKSLAIEAFNNGLIDKFFIKDTKLNDALIEEINLLNRAYFHELTAAKLGKDLASYLYDSNYEKLFNSWLQDFSICEYYRIDDVGSAIGFDKNGKIIWLVLQITARHHDYCEMFNQAHSQKIADNKMIYLFSEHEKNLDPTQWQPYIYDIKGRVTIQDRSLYYAVIQHEYFSLNKKKINISDNAG